MKGRALTRWGVVLGLLAAWCALPPGRPRAAEKLGIPLPEVVIVGEDEAKLLARRAASSPPEKLPLDPVPLPALPRPEEARPPGQRPRDAPPPPAIPPAFFNPLLGGLNRSKKDPESLFFTAHAWEREGNREAALAAFEELRRLHPAHPRSLESLFWEGEWRLGRGEEGAARLLWEKLAGAPKEAPLRSEALFGLGWLAHGEGRHAEARRLLLRLREEDPGSARRAEALFLAAHAALAAKEAKEASRLFGQFLEEAPASPHALPAAVLRAESQFRAEGCREALGLYESALKLPPPEGRAAEDWREVSLFGKGWCLLVAERHKEAAETFGEGLRGDSPGEADEALRLGRLMALARVAERPRFAEALARYRELYPRSPRLASLDFLQGWLALRAGEADVAGRALEEFLDRHPLEGPHPQARFLLGLVRYQEPSYGWAVVHFRRAAGVGAPPDLAARALLYASFARLRLGDRPHGEEDLGGLLNRFPAQPASQRARVWQGELAFQQGKLEEALRAFRAVEPGSEAHPAALYGEGWVHYRRGDWAQAARAFERLAGEHPRTPLASEALGRLAEAYFNLKRYGESVRALDAIIARLPGTPEAARALFRRGKVLYKQGRFPDARKDFEAFLGTRPPEAAAAETLYWRAMVHFRREGYEEARREFRELIEAHPGSPFAMESYLRIGDAYYNQGQFLQADRTYRLAMARFPRHPRARDALYGVILTGLQRGEYAAFVAEARRFIEEHPQNPLTVTLAFQLGEHFFTRRAFAEAEEAYQRVVLRHPESEYADDALLRLAEVYQKQGKVDRAEGALAQLLERHPRSSLAPDASFRRGELLARAGKCPEALPILEGFLLRHPKHDYAPVAHFQAGRCAEQMGKAAEAVAHFREPVAAEGLGALGDQAALHLGRLLFRQGDPEGAEGPLRRATQLRDAALASEARFLLGEALQLLGRDEDAALEYLKLTYLHPDQQVWVERALLRTGEIYARLGRRNEAARLFGKLAEVTRDPRLKELARKRAAALGEAPPGGPPSGARP